MSGPSPHTGPNGATPPPGYNPGDDGQTWSPALAALWDALPEAARDLIQHRPPDVQHRAHVATIVPALHARPGWTVALVVEMAGFWPDGLGCLGEHTEGTIIQEWRWADEAKAKAADPLEGLSDLLSVSAWMERDLPPPEPFLGSVVMRGTRMFLVGTTGLGKSQLGLAMAMGMALGTGFLHWRSSRPVRVLYLDGEMAADLVKQRVVDACRRFDGCRPSGLFVYSMDWVDAVAAQYPAFPKAAPLNTPEGHAFLQALVAIIRPDVIVADNVQALLLGDMKDELTWAGAMPAVTGLTAAGIAQVWIDHTGHNTERQYGSSTKAWQFDSVGIMTALEADQRAPREIGFTLSFDQPGKARRRTPENWDEFSPHIIRLREDAWTSEPVEAPARGEEPLNGHQKSAMRVLVNLLASGAGQTGCTDVPPGCPAVHEDRWRAAFYDSTMPGHSQEAKRKAFCRATRALSERQRVGMAHKMVWICYTDEQRDMMSLYARPE